MRILLVEDEKRIASFIVRGLKEEHFVVDVAYDGEEGMFMAEVNPYDLMIFDWMLPKKDGITMCRELRKKKNKTPVLILTARAALKDKVGGLNAGADDYLTKPFSFEEFLARVRVLLRRQTGTKTPELSVGDLHLNPLNHQVSRANKVIALSYKEFILLQYLMINANQVVTRTMISEHVWNDSFDSMTNVIDVHIKYLRDKIDKGFAQKMIHTIRGAGYILKECTKC